MKKTTIIFTTIVFLFIANCIIAQEDTKQFNVKVKTTSDVTKNIDVTTASKQAEKINESPGIISVITKEEIIGFGANTLSDILNRAASMYMIHAGTYMWNVGSIRGQNISNSDNHILILLNGRPLRDGMSGGFNNVTYTSFPINTIDHIEIIRGPGSVLYGTNAYSGVINIITKKADTESQYEGSVGYGSFNTLSASFNGNAKINDNLDINFGLNYMNDDGPEFEFNDTPMQIPMGDSMVIIPSENGKGNFTKDNKSIFANLNYKGFHLDMLYADLNPYSLIIPFKWKINTNPPVEAGDEMKSFKKYFVDFGYTHKFNEKYSLDLNLTYNWFKAEGWVAGDNDPYATKGLTKNPLLEIAFKASPIKDLKFILGGVYDYNKFEGAQMTDGDLAKYSAYLQAEYKLVEWLKLIAGGQFNKVENLDANFSPRLGAIANLTNNWGMKLLYSSAFRNAYPIETNVNHPSFSGNINLKPELINTAEAQVFFQNKILQSSLTFFNSHMDQLIDRIQDPNNPAKMMYSNVGTFNFYGLEFEAKYSITNKLNIIGSFISQQNKKNDSLKNAAFWPNTIGKAGILYTTSGFSIGVWDSYFGQPTLIENPMVINHEVKGYNLLSANITFDIFGLMNRQSKYKILFSVYADNLLDSEIWYPEFSLQTVNSMPLRGPRSVYGKLSFQF